MIRQLHADIKIVKYIMQQSHPIDNRDLCAELIVSKEIGKLTRPAKKMLIKLGERAIEKMSYYKNYEDKKDCIQTGLMIIFTNWHTFNPEKSTNAFAYFTEVFKRGITQGFNDLHKKRGMKADEKVKVIYINSSNNGEGMFNL
jgi:hypothetical protein